MHNLMRAIGYFMPSYRNPLYNGFILLLIEENKVGFANFTNQVKKLTKK